MAERFPGLALSVRRPHPEIKLGVAERRAARFSYVYTITGTPWGGKPPDSASALHHAQALCNGERLPEATIRDIRSGTQVKALREAFQALGLPS